MEKFVLAIDLEAKNIYVKKDGFYSFIPRIDEEQNNWEFEKDNYIFDCSVEVDFVKKRTCNPSFKAYDEDGNEYNVCFADNDEVDTFYQICEYIDMEYLT